MARRVPLYLGVGDEISHPHTLPAAVFDYHVGYYQPINGRPAPRKDRMGSRALIEFRIKHESWAEAVWI